MDKKNEKKFIQSPVAIICYVLAALMVVYACYQGGSTVKQINEYYASYGMSAKPMEYVTYVLQGMLEPLIHAFTFFIAGYILNAVRKLDPKNFKTASEMADLEDAKKEAKDRKQAAKGEAKAAKAGHKPSEEESVRADFAESLEAELKSDAKTSKSGSRRSGQSRSKNGQGKSGSKSTGSKSNSPKSGSSSNRKKSSAPRKNENEAKEPKEIKEAQEVKEVQEVKIENNTVDFTSNEE